jgi:hypothetical protein
MLQKRKNIHSLGKLLDVSLIPLPLRIHRYLIRILINTLECFSVLQLVLHFKKGGRKWLHLLQDRL